MKRIHIPTVIFHGILLLLAKLLLDDYQDGFLLAAGILLAGHLIAAWVCPGSFGFTHLLGCGVQFLAFRLDLIGPFSGLGSGLSLFFYQIALAASAVLEVLIALIKLRRSPKQ